MNAFLRRTFLALENPQFRLLWIGTTASFLGMQMQVIARGYLAFDLTGKNTALGAVMLAFGIPSLVFTLWGGVLADRLPKRRTLIVSQAVIGANAAWIAAMIAFDMIAFWMLLVAAFVQGVSFAFMGPARQAFSASLVGRGAVGNAVVLQQLSMNGTRMIGPSIAGVFISIQVIGLEGTYLMTTIGFAIAIVTSLWLPRGEPLARDGAARSPIGDLVDGLRYVARRPSVAILILTSFALTGLAFPFQSFLPSLAADVYGSGSRGLGVLSSFQAVGAVAAVVFVAAVASSRHAWRLQPVLALGFGGSVMLLGFTSTLAMGLLAIIVVGAFSAGFQSLNNALSITLSDERYHGRVQSLTALSWSLFGIASAPIGVIADAIGIRETLVLMGAASIGCVVLLRFAGQVWGAEEDRRVPAGREAGEVRAPAVEPEPAPLGGGGGPLVR